ncbi:similar to Saccharomyces cerevisiae YDL097C RPN6 Essential, non-ATPase regulatory subunit of the 26S proteasome lid required for the assembly and activity of the 26S proteasome [Maudiozyma barnettii]|uniref:Similar to Saccharomyces cerevisiae YDL097C RPN6 Essential, non-ATPase regulatory subunit of the 26S proteasome lid required for the assembly and activity of the 26S proteasome n=1 Tax=Maudiozyma barnettii TaxID=61262 RepID=A0A8H2VJT8_9SACH|nr:proteasome regulatory particle lid subunit RPN6 [Kazachstania barnettii]CAB4257081.1 similar to Saccharomyces cerevisiae YDL097C RPN6 Essential, non-ATPase regulatory subunit of the 26S proteasome lid required for the assembly and activity of the 26S proteasome [Kazachstania barnettii]CAD1779452.1 similar to Saccharomyces cerevisiae YDL097C RPN6 Essential, non-ATPase regulatory subunit of the 26S proteasome lid required for the assembly and activity of the 26S proteasome [Kazachstania barnetti
MSLEEARNLVKDKDYTKAEAAYLQLLDRDVSDAGDKIKNEQESAILELGSLYMETHNTAKLRDFIPHSTDYMAQFAKSKTAKVLKTLIEKFEQVPDSLDDQIYVCQRSIEFAKSEKRVFLSHALSIKLATLQYKKTNYKESLDLVNDLLIQFKKLDDKPSLVDVHLLESKVYHKLRNLAKAKAALTAARTAANSIYCPTVTVAELDLMSGSLHCEDKDYKTAFSYFYESFESFHNLTTPSSYERACQVLKYMLLSKIMLNLIDDVKTILNAKYTKETYQSRGIDAMKAVAEAYNNRSLQQFNTALKNYQSELMSDDLVRSHFNALYDTLLESNLCKIIEPFECVEISHISKMIGLDAQQVEGKLSQMILDKVFYGVLDQGNGWLYVYDTPHKDATYDSALELVSELNKTVDLLFDKASVLY